MLYADDNVICSESWDVFKAAARPSIGVRVGGTDETTTAGDGGGRV